MYFLTNSNYHELSIYITLLYFVINVSFFMNNKSNSPASLLCLRSAVICRLASSEWKLLLLLELPIKKSSEIPDRPSLSSSRCRWAPCSLQNHIEMSEINKWKAWKSIESINRWQMEISKYFWDIGYVYNIDVNIM